MTTLLAIWLIPMSICLILQSLVECLNDLDIDKLEEVIEYRNYIYMTI